MSVLPGADGTLVHQDTHEAEEVVAERKKDEQIHEYANARLKSLVKNDEMYYALENFVLRDPERQIAQLGGSEALVSKADKSKTKGEYDYAKSDYEMAAKIEIYKGSRDAARKCLRPKK